MSETTKYEPPKETKGDLGHAGVRSGVGALPVFGQTCIELFNLIVTPPIERRRDEWRRDIGEALRRLEEQERCVVDDLMKNDTFVDSVLQASQAAMRTSQKEKREALQNAVLNSALPNAPDADRQSMFIKLVDDFTSLHIRLLTLLDDPREWFKQQHKDLPKKTPKVLWPLVAEAFPDLAPQQALCELVCKDLHDKGLLIASSLRKEVSRFPYFPDKERKEQAGYRFADELPDAGMVSYSGSPTALRNWTTELGCQFLPFISSPLDVD